MGGSNAALQDRAVAPAVGEWVQILNKTTPEQLIGWRLSAQQGNFYSAYMLTSRMEADWPKLRKNLHELRSAVARSRYKVSPFAMSGADPTPSAVEKAEAFERALHNMSPDPSTDERELYGTIYDLCNAMVNGVAVQNVLWSKPDKSTHGMWVPRATVHVFTPRIGYTQDGCIGVQSDLMQGDFWGNANAQHLDPDQFLVAQYQTRSGPVSTYGLLWPLTWWWMARMYGAEWLFKSAQIFGTPIRWANYPRNSSDATIKRVETLLKQMGNSSFAAFPEGVKMELMKVAQTASDNPQMQLQDLADKYADLTILGQTLTSDVADSGSRALGDVHADTKEGVCLAAARWVAQQPLRQLARAFCRLNWGDEDECPVIDVDTTKPENPESMAKRDSVLLAIPGFTMPKQWLYQRHGVPLPKEGDEVVEGTQQTVPLPGHEEPDGDEQPDEAEEDDLDGDEEEEVVDAAETRAKTSVAFAAALVTANAGLRAQLQAIAALDSADAQRTALKKLYKQFPTLAKGALSVARLRGATDALAEATSAAVLDGMLGVKPKVNAGDAPGHEFRGNQHSKEGNGDSPHHDVLPKNPKKLTIQQASSALQRMGMKMGTPRSGDSGPVYPVEDKDGKTTEYSPRELRDFIYKKAGSK